MGSNNSITLASIEEQKEMRINIEDNLELHHRCCIYMVPKNLRKTNEEAYTPQVISIGPLHHGKEELAYMEKQKIRYKREFSKRISSDAWQTLITFIEKHERRIRNSYAEKSKLEKLEFVTMILYDAVFILELFLKCSSDRISDFLLVKPQIRAAIRLDLQLLENQLPYFVLNGLYMLAFPYPNPDGEVYPQFFSLTCKFFKDSMFNEISEEIRFKHFVDLRRSVITKRHPNPQSRNCIVDLPCAVKLHQSGVKFKGIKGECVLDIRYEKRKRQIPCFKIDIPHFFRPYELRIPRIEVDDETECLIRNVMAWEQCHYPRETHVCNYIDFMDYLINTEEDVNLLVEAGIISNSVGDTEKIAKTFNKLGLQILASSSCFYDIVGGLKAHYNNSWNHTIATLKRVYFTNMWRSTGTLAAIMLLFLTLIQTVCSILQVLQI